MAQARIENLAAFGHAADRLNALSQQGATMRARVKGTIRRRLPPEAKRQITAKFNIAPGYVVKRLRAFFDESSVSLVATWSRTYLANYAPQQVAVGVTVEIVKGQRVTLPHAFIRSTGGYSGGRGAAAGTVFCRNVVLNACLANGQGMVEAIDTSGFNASTDKHGYPISALLGPNVAQMMASAGVEDSLTQFARNLFTSEVDRLAGVVHGG